MTYLQAIATVPDAATARLLAEVLTDGGIEGVEVHTVTGVAYMARASALDYEVRVPTEDLARAHQVMADFEEQSGQAATSQAADLVNAPSADAEPSSDMSRRKPWVLWAAIALMFAMFGPALIGALSALLHSSR